VDAFEGRLKRALDEVQERIRFLRL
jgi:hypothetical protein